MGDGLRVLASLGGLVLCSIIICFLKWCSSNNRHEHRPNNSHPNNRHQQHIIKSPIAPRSSNQHELTHVLIAKNDSKRQSSQLLNGNDYCGNDLTRLQNKICTRINQNHQTKSSQAEWECAECTLIQNISNNQCTLCGSNNPSFYENRHRQVIESNDRIVVLKDDEKMAAELQRTEDQKAQNIRIPIGNVNDFPSKENRHKNNQYSSSSSEDESSSEYSSSSSEDEASSEEQPIRKPKKYNKKKRNTNDVLNSKLSVGETMETKIRGNVYNIKRFAAKNIRRLPTKYPDMECSMAQQKMKKYPDTKYKNFSNHSCNLDDCGSLLRLIIILRRFKIAMENQTYDSQDTFPEISNEYDSTDLLNDYNHVLTKHSMEFENIYKLLNVNVNDSNHCQISQCLMLRRNHRDRDAIHGDRDKFNQLYFFNKSLYFDHVDIGKQQLLDRIHCYLFHSFDTGYKLTNEELTITSRRQDEEDQQNPDSIDKKILDMYNLIQTKKDSFRHRSDLKRLSTVRDKFISNLNQNKLDEYSYGWRFFYWDYFKDNRDRHDQSQSIRHAPLGAGGISEEHKGKYDDGLEANAGSAVCEWYIAAKYNNLKEELTQNEVYTISLVQWDLYLFKAKCLVRTDLGREMKCVRQITASFYEMKEEEPVTPNHLVAILTYCNSDKVQSKFSETYRKTDESESCESLRLRHSNYYFLGRLLRELVECYGMKIGKDTRFKTDEIDVYHGVAKQFSFSSLKAYIKGPCSTTTAFAVAANFCHNKGQILEFKMDVSSWAFKLNEGTETQKQMNRLNGCFDCQWVSDFCNEQEVFCIGGANYHLMETIIIAPRGINYHSYIEAIVKMTWGMTQGEQFRGIQYKKQQYTPVGIQLIYRLMSHELFQQKPDHPDAHEFGSLSDYLRHLLHSHCMSISTITFWTPGDDIKKVVFQDKSGWIKLNILQLVFPNVEKIWIKGQGHESISLMLKSMVYDSMLKFVSKSIDSKLRVVEIIGYQLPKSDTKHVNAVTEYVDKYKQKFADQSWSLKMEIRQHDDGQIYLFRVSFKSMM